MKYVVGEDYLCMYAVIEIILKDIGINKYDQYKLANYFGVTLPENYNIKGVENIKIGKSSLEFGSHINNKQLNRFFDEENISLTSNYLSSNPYGEYPNATYIKKQRYIIFQYSYGSLYNESQNYSVGHSSLLIDNVKQGMIKIYDPGPRDFGEKSISEARMLDAIYDNRGGIFIICRK